MKSNKSDIRRKNPETSKPHHTNAPETPLSVRPNSKMEELQQETALPQKQSSYAPKSPLPTDKSNEISTKRYETQSCPEYDRKPIRQRQHSHSGHSGEPSNSFFSSPQQQALQGSVRKPKQSDPFVNLNEPRTRLYKTQSYPDYNRKPGRQRQLSSNRGNLFDTNDTSPEPELMGSIIRQRHRAHTAPLRSQGYCEDSPNNFFSPTEQVLLQGVVRRKEARLGVTTPAALHSSATDMDNGSTTEASHESGSHSDKNANDSPTLSRQVDEGKTTGCHCVIL